MLVLSVIAQMMPIRLRSYMFLYNHQHRDFLRGSQGAAGGWLTQAIPTQRLSKKARGRWLKDCR